MFHKKLILLFKIIIIIIIILKFYKIKKILLIHKLRINNFYIIDKNNLYLKDKFLINKALINKEKVKILSFFTKKKGQNISYIKSIFYSNKLNFGNLLCSLNKLIFYCQIIGCEKILLDKNIFWFIKNKIKIKNNITLDVIDKRKYNKSFGIYLDSSKLYYKFFSIIPRIRIGFLRLEIIKNLPKIKTNEKSLYIHIRSGDIFKKPHKYYAQPPLCFYQNIIDNYKFGKVYIISFDKLNPVINKLIKSNPNIIYKKNTMKKDISYLINSYNIVASVSSFLNVIISLNFNLKYLWDYNIYKDYEKYFHFHYDLYKYPNQNFKLIRMNPSFKYKKIMFIWKNNRKQIKLMIKEKCNNNIFL